MAKINFGGVVEDVVTREEFPLEKAREVLANETIAVIGYGVQGPGQALNMKDNGLNVIVGQRKGKTFDKAIADGWVPGETLFEIEEALEKGTIICYLLSDAAEEANKKKPAERNEFDKEVLKIDERFNILYNLFSGNYLKIFPNKEDENNTWYSYTHDFKDFTEEDSRFAKTILPAYFRDLNQRKYNEAYEKLNYIKKYQDVIGASIIPSPERIEAELWYNKTNINFWLFQVFFTVGFVVLIMSIVRMFSQSKLVNIIWNGLILLTLISFLLLFMEKN